MYRKKTLIAAGLAGALTAGLGILTPVTSQAANRSGCVDKKTGELRILLKSSKKCSKGWKKIAFNKTGDTGVPGAPGTAGPVARVTVKDAAGGVVGQSMLDSTSWLRGQVSVLTGDGGVYPYELASGKVVTTPGSSLTGVWYTDASCSPGSAVMVIFNAGDYLAGLSSYSRVIDRPSRSLATRAFIPTSNVRALLPTESLSYTYPDGTCHVFITGVSVSVAVLQPVTAPPDHPGPLSFS